MADVNPHSSIISLYEYELKLQLKGRHWQNGQETWFNYEWSMRGKEEEKEVEGKEEQDRAGKGREGKQGKARKGKKCSESLQVLCWALQSFSRSFIPMLLAFTYWFHWVESTGSYQVISQLPSCPGYAFGFLDSLVYVKGFQKVSPKVSLSRFS